MDHLIIATAYDDQVRIYAALTTVLTTEAQRIHDTWPTATAALGRLLTGTVMMGVMSDNLKHLTVEVAGDGPLGKLLAVSNQRGWVKGDIENPHVDLDANTAGKFDVGGAVGEGYLAVLKDVGLKDPYRGIVPLQNGEIATDFAYYFCKSEQTPTAAALGVLIAPDYRVKVAGGLIAQALPGAGDAVLTALEAKFSALGSITSVLGTGISLDRVIAMVAPEDSVKILEEVPLTYRCDCSRERFRGPLLSLGAGELEDITREQGRLEVVCHFCKKTYHFDRTELDLKK